MNNMLLLITLLTLLNNGNHNNCNSFEIINNEINESIRSDFIRYLNFDSLNLEETKLYYSPDKVPINYGRFNLPKRLYKKSSSSHIKRNSGHNSLEDSNYLVFHSDLKRRAVFVEVFYKRNSFLNIEADSEYDTWSRMNGGISYLFLFKKNGCLSEVIKKPFSYD